MLFLLRNMSEARDMSPYNFVLIFEASAKSWQLIMVLTPFASQLEHLKIRTKVYTG